MIIIHLRAMAPFRSSSLDLRAVLLCALALIAVGRSATADRVKGHLVKKICDWRLFCCIFPPVYGGTIVVKNILLGGTNEQRR
jgi:hypothetical protein